MANRRGKKRSGSAAEAPASAASSLRHPTSQSSESPQGRPGTPRMLSPLPGTLRRLGAPLLTPSPLREALSAGTSASPPGAPVAAAAPAAPAAAAAEGIRRRTTSDMSGGAAAVGSGGSAAAVGSASSNHDDFWRLLPVSESSRRGSNAAAAARGGPPSWLASSPSSTQTVVRHRSPRATPTLAKQQRREEQGRGLYVDAHARVTPEGRFVHRRWENCAAMHGLVLLVQCMIALAVASALTGLTVWKKEAIEPRVWRA